MNIQKANHAADVYIPYDLYRTHGLVNPCPTTETGLAEGTNCCAKSEDDRNKLRLLFTALENAFQFGQSAARPAGSMNPRAFRVFKHNSALGCAPSHTLFDAVKISRKPGVEGARSFADYVVTLNDNPLDDVAKLGEPKDLGNGFTLIRRI